MGSSTDKRSTQRRGGRRTLQPETAAKQLRCMELAVRGLTYAEIAEHEGYANESGARHAVAAAFKRSFDAAAEELRPVYQARANTLWRHGYDMVRKGLDTREDEDGNPIGPDLDMVRAGAQIADKALGRLMRLSGLDQPNLTVSVGSAGEFAALKAEFAALLPGAADAVPAVDAEIVNEDEENQQ